HQSARLFDADVFGRPVRQLRLDQRSTPDPGGPVGRGNYGPRPRLTVHPHEPAAAQASAAGRQRLSDAGPLLPSHRVERARDGHAARARYGSDWTQTVTE